MSEKYIIKGDGTEIKNVVKNELEKITFKMIMSSLLSKDRQFKTTNITFFQFSVLLSVILLALEEEKILTSNLVERMYEKINGDEFPMRNIIPKMSFEKFDNVMNEIVNFIVSSIKNNGRFEMEKGKGEEYIIKII